MIIKDLFNAWITLNKFEFDPNDIKIKFSSKEDERELRVSQQTKTQNINIYKNNEIIKTTNNYDEFDLLRKDNLLYECLYHYTYYAKRSNFLNLIYLIQHKTIKLIKEKYLNKVEYLRSVSEADIFIKAFYNKYLKDDESRTLIISNDTDYCILFGEYNNVDILTVSNFNLNKTKNPFCYWSDLFKTESKKTLRLILCRLSALFGNDYTLHNRKIVCDKKFIKDDNLQKLFNMNNYLFKDINVSSVSSMGKFVKELNVYSDKIDLLKQDLKSKNKDIKYLLTKHFKLIDYTILKNTYDDKQIKYFNGYYETLLIYLNFEKYVNYDDLIKGEFNLKSKVKKPLPNISLIDSDEVINYNNLEENLIEEIKF